MVPSGLVRDSNRYILPAHFFTLPKWRSFSWSSSRGLCRDGSFHSCRRPSPVSIRKIWSAEMPAPVASHQKLLPLLVRMVRTQPGAPRSTSTTAPALLPNHTLVRNLRNHHGSARIDNPSASAVGDGARHQRKPSPTMPEHLNVRSGSAGRPGIPVPGGIPLGLSAAFELINLRLHLRQPGFLLCLLEAPGSSGASAAPALSDTDASALRHRAVITWSFRFGLRILRRLARFAALARRCISSY